MEDVDEEPYRIDRMLTQIVASGVLSKAAGLIWGECQDCRPRDFQPSNSSPYTLGEVVRDIFSSLTMPIISGFTIGHTDDQTTLPIGPQVNLDANARTLTYLEGATI